MTGLRDLVVVEIAGSVAGAYAGRLFAGWGASVTVIGSDSGSGPALTAYLDSAKQRLSGDAAEAGRLIEQADVVIESSSPDPLRTVSTDRPGLVRVEISPFGRDGPYQRRRSTELTDQAVSGHLFLNGDPDREPLAGPAAQVLYASGLHGFIGATAALCGRRDGTVEVSHQEVMTSLHQFTLLRWLNTGDILRRMGNRYAGPGQGCGLFRCTDGYVSLIIPRDDQLERALAVTDGFHLLSEPGIEHAYDLMHHPTLLDDHLTAWFETKATAEAIAILQEVRVPAGPTRTIPELLDDDHLRARDFWVDVDGIRHPGPPVRIHGHPWRTEPPPRPPPLSAAERPGHGRALSPLSPPSPSATDRRGHGGALPLPPPCPPSSSVVTDRRGHGGALPLPPPRPPSSSVVTDRRGHGGAGAVEVEVEDGRRAGAVEDEGGGSPLAGVRVIDLTRVWAGPLATRILADLGADVIMVEAPWNRGGPTIDAASIAATRYYPDDDPGPDHWNRIGFVNKFATGKRGISLDLTKSGALDVLERLITSADVVIENFSPRVMPQLGLDDDRLASINPDLVYVTMPGYGRTGPDADNVAYGPVIDSHAGLSSVMGYRDETARKGGIAWPDPVAGMHAAAGAIVSLLDARSGEAGGLRVVEVAQLEACINMVGHAVVAAGMPGRGSGSPGTVAGGPGNRDPRHVPQGVYPGSGDDRWIAVSLVDDDTWPDLAGLVGIPDLAQLSRTQRWERHDEIDERLAAWTSSRTVEAAVTVLTGIGLAAAPLADAAQVMNDPNLRHRGAFFSLDHPSAGIETWPHTPIKLLGGPRPVPRPAPRLGEHNREIVVDELGFDPARYRELLTTGALAERPPH